MDQNTVLVVAGGGGGQGDKSFFSFPGGLGGDAIITTGNGLDGAGFSPGNGGLFGGAPTGNGGDGVAGNNGIGVGGGGGGRSFISSGNENAVQLDTMEYRRIAEVTLPDPGNPRIQNGYLEHGETTDPQDGFVSITPLFINPQPPVVTYVITPESPDGNNGWYRSDFTVSWQVSSDFQVTSQNGCQFLTQTTDSNNFLTACTAENVNGSLSKSTPLLKRDATLPNITAVAVQQGGVTTH